MTDSWLDDERAEYAHICQYISDTYDDQKEIAVLQYGLGIEYHWVTYVEHSIKVVVVTGQPDSFYWDPVDYDKLLELAIAQSKNNGVGEFPPSDNYAADGYAMTH